MHYILDNVKVHESLHIFYSGHHLVTYDMIRKNVPQHTWVANFSGFNMLTNPIRAALLMLS